MTKSMDAQQYWQSYYSQPFVYGMGTEVILGMLRRLPAVKNWVDIGCGSESLLWACALRAEHLTAVDSDSERLELLQRNAQQPRPSGSYETAMELGGREPHEWGLICRTLQTTITADCLHGDGAELPRGELITQFGLLGLCSDSDQFAERFSWMAQLTTANGMLAGANWMSAIHPGRLQLTEALYQDSCVAAGVELIELTRIPSIDPNYPEIWAYVGRRATTPA